MEFRAYKMTDLSKEKNGPDDVHYETVRSRVKHEKHIKITFETGAKHKKENVLYLDFQVSEKLNKALELYTKWKQGKIKFKN